MSFRSHYPIERVELVVDGQVVCREEWPQGRREGVFRRSFRVERDGWVAARLWGDSRDSFGHAIYAHTSPVYFRVGRPSQRRPESARFFLNAIEDSLKWIDTWGRYNSDRQREEVRELFRRGREVYAGLV